MVKNVSKISFKAEYDNEIHFQHLDLLLKLWMKNLKYFFFSPIELKSIIQRGIAQLIRVEFHLTQQNNIMSRHQET